MSASTTLKLQRAGFTESQVDALVDLVEHEGATKADLIAAEGRLENRIDKLDAKVDGVEQRLNARIDRVEMKVDHVETKLSGEIATLRILVTTLIGLVTGVLILLLGLALRAFGAI